MHHNRIIKNGDATQVEKEILVDGVQFIDKEPVEGSFNPVTSDAVFKAIDEAKEDMQEKIDEVTLDPSAVALGNVHLLDEVTELPADGCILIDSETNGPVEMSKDKLLELTAQNALKDIVSGSPNIYDQNAEGRIDNKFIGPNGYISSTNYYVSSPIKVTSGVRYKATHSSTLGSNYNYAVVDKNGDLISIATGTDDEGNTNFIVFTPSSTGFVRLNLGMSGSLSTFMCCEYSNFPETYVPFGLFLNDIVYFGEEQKKESALIAQDELKDIVSDSPNLFNKDADGIITGYFIGPSGYISGYGYYISYPIYVKAGVTYKASRNAISLGDNFRYAVVDENGNFVSSKEGTDDNGDANFLVFVPASSGYIRLNLATEADIRTFMLTEYAEYPATFVPFGLVLNDTVHLGDTQKQESALIVKGSNLIGKTIALNGDSICYGAGFIGGYGKIIADTFRMTYQNIAVAGATIQAETYYQNSTPRHWISRTISSMRADADYAIVEGGVNDDISTSMGELSEGLTASLDDTTFYGAFESMLKQLLIRYPGKKVGYIAVHQVPGWNPLNTDVATSKFIAAKRCCDKWGVPFLDLASCIPPFGNMPNSGDLYTNLKAVYTNNADGWHPNESGYRSYYVEKIVEWMNSI